jgi:hypothetical protein
MAMTSMATGDDGPTTASKYGYGLCITLNGEQCEALGIKGPIKPGTTLGLQAIAMVTSATERLEGDDDDGETDVMLSLQITDLDINTGSTNGQTATLFYGAS